LLTREPGATEPGAKIREVLLHGGDLTPRAEALLFAADRAHHVEAVVRPALAQGQIVVTDRYADSSVAYQGTGRDLGTAEVSQLSRWATDGLVPDLTIVLDVEPGTGRSRRADEHDRLEQEPDDFHARVRERFLALAARAPSRYLVVDAALGPQEIHSQVVARLTPVLPESAIARAAREEREAAQEQARLAAERERQHRAEVEAQVVAERQARRKAEEQARRAAAEQAELDAQLRAAAEQAAAARAAAERAAAEQAELEVRAAQAAQAARERAVREADTVAHQTVGRAGRHHRADDTLEQPAVHPTVQQPTVQPGEPPALDDEIFDLGEREQR
jgi:dTMP kinase